MFYVRYTSSLSITLFEIIKQRRFYTNIFELVYLTVNIGFPNICKNTNTSFLPAKDHKNGAQKKNLD